MVAYFNNLLEPTNKEKCQRVIQEGGVGRSRELFNTELKLGFHNTGPNKSVREESSTVYCSLFTSDVTGAEDCRLLFQRSYVIGYNGGQKCWDLSSGISKTSDPSPPTLSKS